MNSISVSSKQRVSSIDILRGLVMVLMAIDHVRVYSGIPAVSVELGEFFTRWVTYFCAPAFTFFAGTSIFFMDSKMKDKSKLAKQLVLRGVILIFLELIVMHFFWTFNLNITDFVLAGVIWMLGCCMILMAAFIWLKLRAIVVVGLCIILFQSLLTNVPDIVPEFISGPFLSFWKFFYPTGLENPRTDTVTVLYVIIPWIGVMMTGYAFGSLFQMDAAKRKKICLIIGSVMVTLFLIIGTVQFFSGNTMPTVRNFIFELLGQKKYPVSPMFLLMTLGPLILAVPFVEQMKGRVINGLCIIGRVPLFYYLLHIPLIHLSALLLYWVNGAGIHPEWFEFAPFTFVPKESTWSLGTLYLVFVVDVIILYFLCKWYANYKFHHREKKWLKFL